MAALVAPIILSLISGPLIVASSANFYQDVDIIRGDDRGKVLDKASGSGFQSKDQFLYGKIDMQIKLVAGNSAGTVTTYYLRPERSSWDEIDFEFLGNLSGNPCTVHTNVYTQGKGDREQQFYLWFDPTADFHTYSILWNPAHIVFYVDGRPIREFKHIEGSGIAYPRNQPMRLYSGLWNADDWTTRGGLVKTDWSQAPFSAAFRNFRANGCVWSSGVSSCKSNSDNRKSWLSQKFDSANQKMLRWVQNNYMVFNYCADTERFLQGVPAECTITTNS